MTQLDRYLNAVTFFLTSPQHEDIVRELRENLSAELDDRADRLERPLTEAEIADVLRRHGHPLLVAGRYGARQHLIGPTMLPLYVVALKLGLVAAALVTGALTLVEVASSGEALRGVIRGISRFPDRAVMVFGWTTLVFAVLEYLGPTVGREMDWDPRTLPDWMTGSRRMAVRPANWLKTFTEACFGLLMLAWALAVPYAPWLAFGPVADRVEFAPVWRLWYVPLVVALATVVVSDWLRIFRPRLTELMLRVRLAGHGLQAAAVTGLLSAGTWFVGKPGAAMTEGPHGADGLAHTLDVAVSVGAIFVIGATLVEIGKDIARIRASKATDEESR